MIDKSRTRKDRCGFTLLETLLALAVLAVASGFTLKMHQTRMEYDRSATNRLMVRLAIENVAEQLAVIDYEEIQETAERLATESDVQILVSAFDAEDASGWHLTIAGESNSGPLRRHLWRLEESP